MTVSPVANKDEVSIPQMLLTIVQAAQALNLSRSLMYDLVLSGQVFSIKIQRSRRVPVAELQAFIDRHHAVYQQDKETTPDE